MHKNTLWLLFFLLCIYLTLVFCEEQQPQQGNIQLSGYTSRNLQEEPRTRRHRHHLHHLWGWHALAIAYLVKIKIVVVSFFVGSAIYLGLRYLWPTKCNTEIILDHPPPTFSHHDHIPYSLGHSGHYIDHPPFDSTSYGGSSSGPDASYEPYSAYSGKYGEGPGTIVADTTSTEAHQTFRKKREIKQQDTEADGVEVTDDEDDNNQDEEQHVEARQRPTITEEQIGNFMFSFLGLDSKSCRLRFICEMEFRSRANPLTAMAFRVIGRSFFGKYTNDRNELGRAKSYQECASVNSQCVFIENDEVENEEPQEEQDTEVESITEPPINELKVDLPINNEDNSLESNNIEERANYHNLLAERRNAFHRRVRGDRHLKQG